MRPYQAPSRPLACDSDVDQDARNCRNSHEVQKTQTCAGASGPHSARNRSARCARSPLYRNFPPGGRSGIGPLLYLPTVSASRTGTGERQSKCDLASPILPPSRCRRMHEPTPRPASSRCVKRPARQGMPVHPARGKWPTTRRYPRSAGAH